MSLFGTKKPSSEPVVPEAVAEHKQSIGNQVMEALGVGEGANEYNKDEETEVMMPAKNQSQLAAEEMVKQHENICVISKDAIIRGGIEAKLPRKKTRPKDPPGQRQTLMALTPDNNYEDE